MLIGKRWKVESDSLNVTLFKKMGRDKKEYWRAEGYFSNFQNALKGLADYEIKGTGLDDLKRVSKRQDEIYQLIETIANKKT